MLSSYDKTPFIPVSAGSSECDAGWADIRARIGGLASGARTVIAIECYPGVFEDDIEDAFASLDDTLVIRTRDCLKPEHEIERMVAHDLTHDPVFGCISHLELREFFDQARLAETRRALASSRARIVIAIGVGAILVAPEPDFLVYADLARWEIQQRQRRGEIGNLGVRNADERPALKYKRAFFIDWRVCDRLKKNLLPRLDFLLDTNQRDEPKMIAGGLLREGLSEAVRRPFRVVPFFDPGPWGGEWMRRVCSLPGDAPNYAWCFDCVPDENSLLLGFGAKRVEIPAIDLVFSHPRELLGDAVHARFGTEFPIRFDFLDTMQGGNLSLQVHPLTEYIQQHFGMHYTQDESYYLLDAAEDACVFLGVKEDVDRAAMVADLKRAQEGGPLFPAERYVNRWPAKKHDHFLIPAGTVHCSGCNSMVLEISATPYIFTFKLWDWGRLGLDGRPRPVHLEHGVRNIQWDRTTSWVSRELINRVHAISQGKGWREEATGLHRREFIETRRHWFTGTTPHDTGGGVNVLNLVEGPEAIVESPENSFESFPVHYAETFIVPAAVGPYTVRPARNTTDIHATIKAFVRTGLCC